MAQIAEIASARASAPTLLQRIVLARGWTRRAIAFCAGAAGALALAPFDLSRPCSRRSPSPSGSSTARRTAKTRRALPLARFVSAAGAGWWLGFGYFVAGLWWMGAAMLVEADQFAWALPLAVFGLPAVLAVFPAAGFALARLLWSPGGARVFALAAGLGAAEWLRGHLFTGFPWNDFGMALTSAGPMAQTASLVGLHGLDIIAIVIFAAPATLIDRAPRDGRRIGGTMFAAAALAMLMFAYGVFRLGANETEYVDGVALRLMQPNLPQDAKFRPENGAKILRHYLDLSERATNARPSGLAEVTHLVWPESAFPYVISRHPEALAAIARALKGGVLLTGAARAEGDGDGRRGRDLQFDRGAEGRVDRRLLRQGSSRPLRRISAAGGPAAAAWNQSPRSRHLGPRRGSAPARGARSAAHRAAHLLRSDFFRARRSSATPPIAPFCFSTSPMTDGSAARPAPISIWPRRACARSKKGCQ